jgi:hypothetical protein
VRATRFLVTASLLLVQGGLWAQGGGTDPKPKPEDYESHGQARATSLGADFMIHSFSGQGVTYVAPDYLVVEVALYPPKGSEINVQPLAFALRLDGKRTLAPVSTSMVASSLPHPEWRQGPRLEAGAGVGGGGVVLGAPRPAQPIPGGPPVTGPPQQVPGSDQDPTGTGVSRTPPVPAAQLLVETALPTGKFPGPVSGYLYFPYRGKAGSLKTVELLYEDAVVKLR